MMIAPGERTFLRQLHVVPAREAVLLVPLALAVADEHERVRVLGGALLLAQRGERARGGGAGGQRERAVERENHRGEASWSGWGA